MVSPSKKNKKPDCKSRENGLLNKSNSKKPSKVPVHTKPLLSKRFYLDVKNPALVSKIEKKLKLLGATIEVFLIKEVDYIVSDRNVPLRCTRENSGDSKTPGTATPSPSPSPAFLSSPADGGVPKKSRTRAATMLEKICLQPNHIDVNPLEKAISWNIPIFSLKNFLQRLEKLCTKFIPHSNSSRSKQDSLKPGLRILRGHYIKIETGKRPEFREFDDWPCINFNSKLGECPFSAIRQRNENKRKANRKILKDQEESDKNLSGYCELCHVDYADIKSHIVSVQHKSLATNAEKFAQLDNLIKTKNIESFVATQMCPSLLNSRRSLRSGSVDVSCPAMGMRNSVPQSTTSAPAPPLPNGKILTRTRSSSIQLRQSLDDNFTKKTLKVQCNGAINHCHYTRYAVKSDTAIHKEANNVGESLTKRSRSISASCPGEFLQLSPTGSDSTHHLRSRKQIILPSNLIGTTAEDALRSRGLRDSLPDTRALSSIKSSVKSENKFSPPVSPVKSIKTIPTPSPNLKSGKNSLNCKMPRGSSSKKKKFNRRRLNPEEKLLEDNKAYYKVEVLNTKLRSTGYYLTQRELELSKVNGADSSIAENCVLSKNDVKPEEKEPVVVRFQKIRKTELTLLSDEAENFMFGEPIRKESSENSSEGEEEDFDDDEETSTTALESEDNKKSIKLKIKKEDIQDENSIGSCSITSSCSSYRRKRQTQAEAFIRDNFDYYKFELSGSRLRYQGSILPHIPPDPKESVKSEDDHSKEISKTSECIKKKILEEESEDGKDIINNDCDGNEKLDQITFSFEEIPENETWYKTYKRQDDCKEVYYPAYHEYPKVLLPYQFPSSFRHNLSNSEKGFVRKRHSRFPILDDKPRKSPRCHASTLAIMSSLLRKKGKDPSPNTSLVQTDHQPNEPIFNNCEDSRSSFNDIPLVIPEIKVENKLEKKKNIKEILKVINDVISKSFIEDEDDKYAQTLKAIKKDLDSDKDLDSSPKRGKVKTPRSSATKREFSESDMCLPVDSNILTEVGNVSTMCSPGPIVDVISLLDTFKYCSSMERADYEHMNPHAIDALRVLTVDGSCNGSDCGASSTCDMSFLDDGRTNRRKKRKKRNLTGWPLGKPRRKLVKKFEEGSPVCKEEKDSFIEDKTDELTPVNSENVSECVSESKNSVCSSPKTIYKKLNSLSRTMSVDSTSRNEIQECCIKISRLSESSTKDGYVLIKKSMSSDSLHSSPNKTSPRRNLLRRQSSGRWSNSSVRKYR
uniref:DBF4-type domain-containing protein n=1 Tax=Clastoptera arizonana TaxID=38151 RepID=A0A1B6DQA9_9HEMI